MTLNLKELEPQVEAMTLHIAGGRFDNLKLGEIRPSRWQPRDATFDPEALWELAKSIEENGLINPVVVFPCDDGYELVAGERRLRAKMALFLADWFPHSEFTKKEYVQHLADVGIAGLNRRELEYLNSDIVASLIQARIEPAEDLSRLHRLAVVENLERENLSVLEEARALDGLMQAYGWTQREVAERLGKSQGWVAQRVGLLELPGAAQEEIGRGGLTLTHARALQGLSEDVGEAVTQEIAKRVKKVQTTRDVEGFTRAIKLFLDPEQYAPAEGLQEPAKRNWLAMLRWLVTTTDWDAHSEALVKLERHGTLDNVRKHPGSYYVGMLAEKLGYADVEALWEAFAEATSRFCPGMG